MLALVENHRGDTFRVVYTVRFAKAVYVLHCFQNVTFLDVRTMLDTLSPRRLDLLRHVRQHGAGNVKGLAQVLGRDYKNVHTDVAVLEAAGLLVRDGRKLAAPWDGTT